MTSVQERFWAKVIPAAWDACWEWGAALRTGGYGAFWDGIRHVQAHRFAYELMVGPIPEGLYLDHLCRNPPCVNPEHLEPVTPRENMMRGVAIDGTRRRYARMQFCIAGHPLFGPNLYVQKKTGYRYCRACQKRRSHEAYLRKRDGATSTRT